MSEWMEPDLSEAEEYIEKVPAPAGEYEVTIKSPPRYKVSKNGTPYLEWFLVHGGENAKFAPVYERTMLTGKGAFRYFQILQSMGYTAETIKKTFKYRALAEITEENSRDGVPVELMIEEEKLMPVNTEIRVKLRVGTTNTGNERSEVESFLK